MRRGNKGGGARDGALLLEVMLALAIFVMAGTAILMLVDRTVTGMERVRAMRKAADLARSAMAKMEAGLGTPQSLNGPVRAWGADEESAAGPSGEGTSVKGSGVLEAAATDSGWELRIDTEPSQFRGLTRVTVKAFKSGAGDEAVASYTLRQLVRLSGKGEDVAGGADALAEQAKKGLESSGGGTAPKRGGGS